MSELLYANHLKELRQKAGMSLQDLADCIGMSKQHVHQLEMVTANPTIKTAYSIAWRYRRGYLAATDSGG